VPRLGGIWWSQKIADAIFDRQYSPRAFEGLKRATRQSSAMELRVLSREDRELALEIAGEDHTFMNVLKGALLETDGVTAATYDMNPEQSGGQTDPVLTVTTEEGVDPLEAISEAASDIQTTTDAFRDAFRDASAAA
jgi:DNA-directed RNA polymerase subunit L